MLLSFRDRTPKRTDRWVIELLNEYEYECLSVQGSNPRLLAQKTSIRFSVHVVYNIKIHLLMLILYNSYVTAGWSSGLKSRLRNQRSRVQIPVVSRGFCDEHLHLLTSHDCLYILLSI
jgi:hypothetical protein